MASTTHDTSVKPRPLYVQKALDAMTPAYFLIKTKPEKGGYKAPNDSFTNSDFNFSRVFDLLPQTRQQSFLSEQEVIEFYNNAYTYSFEYAIAIAVNPLIEALVDIENQKLQTSFMENQLGMTEAELLAQLKKVELKSLEPSFEELKTRHSELSDEEINARKVQIAIEKFNEKYDTDETFNRQMNFKLAHGFTDACKILFGIFVAELEKDLNSPYYLFIPHQIQSKYDAVQNVERTGLIKLYNKNHKIHFCSEMMYDINELVNKHPKFHDGLTDDFADAILETHNDFFKKNKALSIAFFQFYSLQQKIYDCLNSQIKALNAVCRLLGLNDIAEEKVESTKIAQMSLIEKNNLLKKLKAEIKKAEVPPEHQPEVDKKLGEASEFEAFIRDGISIVNKYKKDQNFETEPLIEIDYYENIKRDHEVAINNNSRLKTTSMIATALTAVVVAASIALVVTTFGAGIAIIPLIPSIVSVAVASAISIGAVATSIYFKLKYRDASQKVNELDEKLGEMPLSTTTRLFRYLDSEPRNDTNAPQSEERESVDSNASTVDLRVGHGTSPTDSEEAYSSDSDDSDDSDDVPRRHPQKSPNPF